MELNKTLNKPVKWLSFDFTLKIIFSLFQKDFHRLTPFRIESKIFVVECVGLSTVLEYAVAQKQDLCADLISLYNKKEGKNKMSEKCSTQKSFSLVVSFGTFFFEENHMMII